MLEISQAVAIEIFTHLEDLEITVGINTCTGQFALGICRGTKGQYRRLISVDFLKDKNHAIWKVEEILLTAQKTVKNEPSRGLSQELINCIIEELNQNGAVNTCDISVEEFSPRKFTDKLAVSIALA